MLERRGWRSVIAHQAKEFCLSTGLHGYKYIAQSNRSLPERVTWAFGVLVSLCCAVALMHIAWEYNASHPSLTVIESTHHGIWNYRFPAVTVCDINRVSLKRAIELANFLDIPESMSNDSIDLVTDMRFLNELIDAGVFADDINENLTRLQDIFEANNLTIDRVVDIVTRNCSELMVRCKWKGDVKPCETLFRPSLSRDGLCCSFNYFDGGNSNEQSSTYDNGPPQPRRVTACGYQTGLTVLMDSEPEDYHASLYGGYGVKVMLHDPYDYPDRNAENKLVGVGEEVFLSVTPEVTYSTDDIRSLTVSTRECVFPDEGRKINENTAMPNYSYRNCLALCRAQTILDKCRCVPYYQRDLYYSGNESRSAEKTCDLKDVACAYSFRDWFETSWPGTKVTWQNLPSISEALKPTGRPCGCIPDCELTRYPLESSTGIFDRNNSYQDLTFYKGIRIRNHSVLHVFFSDLVSTQYRRDVYYNWHNLFASFGGLLGLFAGFSLMSAFELIYFFSIRLIADLCTAREKHRF